MIRLSVSSSPIREGRFPILNPDEKRNTPFSGEGIRKPSRGEGAWQSLLSFRMILSQSSATRQMAGMGN